MSRDAVKKIVVDGKAALEAEIASMNKRIGLLQSEVTQLQIERDDAVRKLAAFDETIADIDAKSAAELPPIETENPL